MRSDVGASAVRGPRAGWALKTAAVAAMAFLHVPLFFILLYAFSIENWKRPKREIDTLMRLLSEFLEKEIDEMNEHNIRFTAIGRTDELPTFVQKRLERTIRATEKNTGLTLNLALNYGGRSEIVDAVRKIATEVKRDQLHLEEITEDSFPSYLYTHSLPDPDLLIRTSGEMRISNFLLWQISYSEIYVTKKFWPDFTKEDLKEAIRDFQRRERRFGATVGTSGAGQHV